jgi:hypothetical protein
MEMTTSWKEISLQKGPQEGREAGLLEGQLQLMERQLLK